MGWLVFALALGLLLYTWWRVRRGWIEPVRELEQVLQEIASERMPHTFLISGSQRLRGLGLTLEQIALRNQALRARVQQGEFGVQAIVGALADGLVVADREHRIRLTNKAFCEIFHPGSSVIGATLLETARDAAVHGC